MWNIIQIIAASFCNRDMENGGGAPDGREKTDKPTPRPRVCVRAGYFVANRTAINESNKLKTVLLNESASHYTHIFVQ